MFTSTQNYAGKQRGRVESPRVKGVRDMVVIGKGARARGENHLQLSEVAEVRPNVTLPTPWRRNEAQIQLRSIRIPRTESLAEGALLLAAG